MENNEILNMPATCSKPPERIRGNGKKSNTSITVPRTAFRVIDLFSGAGGMTLGFTSLSGYPFEVVWANDFDEAAVATYNANFGSHCLLGDLNEILGNPKTAIPEAEIVIGGPPCQGFSLLNKKRDGDPRKELWRPYMEIVAKSKAVLFVMENVPQLLGTAEHQEIIEAAGALGFTVRWAKLCAADYGVPQLRWRAFIVGCKFVDPSVVFPPVQTHIGFNGKKRAIELKFIDRGAENKASWRTVRDAIGDLPKPVGTEIRSVTPPMNLHFGRTPSPKSVERYRSIPKQGMNRFDLQRLAPHLTPSCWIRKKNGGTDLFGRLWWDRPSFTIRTEFFKPEKGRYLHPDQHRPITHREAARLQTFPDEFKFVGGKTQIAKQIGNAVPPLLAAKIAQAVYKLLMVKR